jgi:hypothetical protein
MSKLYIIIAQDEPETISEADLVERTALLEQYGKSATYAPYRLIAMESDRVQALIDDNPDNKVDLSGYGIVATESDKINDTDKTEAEFLAIHDQLAAQDPTGQIVILSVPQGKLLYNERYAPVETETV